MFKYLKLGLICCLLIACEQETSNGLTPEELAIEAPTQIGWKDLIPADYSAEAIFAKYETQLNAFEDDDPQAEEMYQQMMSEINNAPPNPQMNQKHIKLPGFVAPLKFEAGKITEFLLVPYFGACIHVPPPPMNQIVLIKTEKNQGIDTEQAYSPIWVIGTIKLEQQQTKIGNAGYRIENALTEMYEFEIL
ncbi:DUF3299 domain-containing protein [Candidatus Albibeggiatoa sp. nov. BB20]|uniref:DUF3299 domain-containing protein n=1 Tax=Candidatus Albibeggiatoa sp. nov. BB20 TaxID=3162723 RepID=UPI0033656743